MKFKVFCIKGTRFITHHIFIIKPKAEVKKVKNEFGGFSGFLQWNLGIELIMDSILNFMKPFSFVTHFQNRFPQPVDFGTYVLSMC